MEEKQAIKEQLMELLDEYYNGSFSQMVCDHIRSIGMSPAEVEELLEAMKHFGEYPHCTYTRAYR